MLFMEEKHLTIASVKAAYQSGEKTPTGLMQEIIEKAKKYSDKNIWIIEPDMERIRPYIEKLGKMDFGKKPFTVKVLNTNQIVHSMEELIWVAGEFV